MKSVLIIGHDAGGKSSIGQFLSNHYKTSLQIAFASQLKTDLASLRLPVYSKPYSQSLRNLVRQYGETMMELYGDLYWVDQTFNAYDEIVQVLGEPDLLVCDDCRQWHELYAWVKKFEDTKIIVLQNNNMKESDYAYRSVIEVNEMIRDANLGLIPSLVINNIFTTNGLTEEVKQSLLDYVVGN